MGRFVNPIPQYILANGDLASSGTLEFYEFNTDTLLVIYGDDNETISIPNPVSLGERGEVPNIFFSVAARVILKDSEGNIIFDVQPVINAGGGTGGIGGWNANSTYNQLNIVYASNGDFYISLINDNTGNDPTDDSDDSQFWTRLELLRYWNNQQSFDAGELVVRGSTIYISQITDNLNNDPATDTLGNWKDLTSADLNPYDNTASGLSASTVQAAIDQLRSLINSIVQPFAYLGTLDVSGGDPSLPAAPANGDLYVIGIGGTITVSTNGGAATPTVVTTGQRIAWNNSETRWDLLPFAQNASDIAYSNVTSGLAANNVQDAVDEVEGRVQVNEVDISAIQSTLSGLGDGVRYKGVLDASGGDAVLPVSPAAGDLYVINIEGTLTVSVNGAAPTPTVVSAGQQIVYNSAAVQWDLLASIFGAGEVSYDNTISGLSAVNVQLAIDEVVAEINANAADINALQALDTVNFSTLGTTANITRQGTLTDVTKANDADLTYTIVDAGFVAEDIVRVRKTLQAGSLTINTTGNQIAPDGTTDTSSNFPDGSAGTVELKFNGSAWALRVY